MDIRIVFVLIMIAVIALTALVTWRITLNRRKTQCIGDIYVDWTDPQDVAFYLALDKPPDESIKDHDIVYMRVRPLSQ